MALAWHTDWKQDNTPQYREKGCMILYVLFCVFFRYISTVCMHIFNVYNCIILLTLAKWLLIMIYLGHECKDLRETRDL